MLEEGTKGARIVPIIRGAGPKRGFLSPRIFALSFLLVSHSLFGVEVDRHTPETAIVREEILAVAEQLKGFGTVQWTEFHQQGRHMLVISYDPFSGRAATYVHLYFYDDDRWIRFNEEFIEGTHAVSFEIPVGKQQLVIRGASGAIVTTLPLPPVR